MLHNPLTFQTLKEDSSEILVIVLLINLLSLFFIVPHHFSKSQQKKKILRTHPNNKEYKLLKVFSKSMNGNYVCTKTHFMAKEKTLNCLKYLL